MNPWQIATADLGLAAMPPPQTGRPGWPEFNSSAHRFLTFIETHPGCQVTDLMAGLSVTQAMVSKYIRRFNTLLFAKRVGGQKRRYVTTYYILGSDAAIEAAKPSNTPPPDGEGKSPATPATASAILLHAGGTATQAPVAEVSPSLTSGAVVLPDPETSHLTARRTYFAVDEEGFVGIQDIDDGRVKLSPADLDALIRWAQTTRPIRNFK